MKKLFLILCLTLFSLSLTGCIWSYEDTSKKDMDLINVKVYDSENKEIEGTYKNYFLIDNLYEDETTDISYGNFEKVNSAAPVFNYYVIDAKADEVYTVKFILSSKRRKNLTKLLIHSIGEGESLLDEFELIDISKNSEGNFEVTFNLDHSIKKNEVYKIVNWYDGDSSYRFGSTGRNTYIKGVIFMMPNSTNTSCAL